VAPGPRAPRGGPPAAAHPPSRRRGWGRIGPAWHLAIFSLVLIGGLTVVLLLPLFPGQVEIAVGQPARDNYLSPRYFKYESAVLTAQDRATAEADTANLAYARNSELIESQRNALVATLNSILDILSGTETTPTNIKRQQLMTVPNVTLSETNITALINLTPDAALRLRSETLGVYDLLMRSSRIGDSGQLERTRSDLTRQFTATLPPADRLLASDILRPFLAVNMRIDTAATEEARQKAAAAVPAHVVEVQKGEAILRVGQIADALAVEKLEKAGLRNREVAPAVLVASAGVITLLVLILQIYLLRFQPAVWHNGKQLLLLGLVILAPMGVARFMVPGHAVLPYLVPMATVSMLVAVLLDANLAMVVTVVLSLLVSLLAGGSVEMPIYYLVSGVIGVFALWRAERANTFIVAGAYVAAGAFAAAVLMRVVNGGDLDQSAVATLAAAALINGGLSASLTFAMFSVLGSLFGLTTVLQLMELAHPTQPLLRRLMHEAPGTYHHSLVVSNLAERAAELVGADPLLARVAAYYHDIGKVLNPSVFIDNQAGAANVHDTLDPYTSARLIRDHVTEGVKLAMRSRLPRRLVDAIPQHHGTTLIKYFYHKALESDPNVDEAIFRYPGPKPQTKETAILMLADSVEATVRSLSQSGQLVNLGPEDCRDPAGAAPDTIPAVVRKVIRERLEDGQLDESDLTVRDLARIQEAFCAMLSGIYHPRITYPERPTIPVVIDTAPNGAHADSVPGPANGAHRNGPGTVASPVQEGIPTTYERRTPTP
jgi:putative nucleotidyltransferase with HDIG domain